MNLAQIVDPNGRIGADTGQYYSGALLVDADTIPRQSITPQVTVREWQAHLHRHIEIYAGPMRFAHIRTLAAERSGLPTERCPTPLE